MFAAYRKRRALKRYAQELPPRLQRDYGGREYFTRAQIDVAVRKLRLDPKLVVYAYALFLARDEYQALHGATLPAYSDARAELLQYVTARAASAHNFNESGLGFPAAGGRSDPGGL
ncbi:MAG TPA: DUF6559 family protein [Rhizomicrobium sp.]|jgi:hypothetical protein